MRSVLWTAGNWLQNNSAMWAARSIGFSTCGAKRIITIIEIMVASSEPEIQARSQLVVILRSALVTGPAKDENEVREKHIEIGRREPRAAPVGERRIEALIAAFDFEPPTPG